EQFHERFPNAPVEQLPNELKLTGIRVLAYLQKTLPFPDVMQRFSEPLQFPEGTAGKSVDSFGHRAFKGELDHLPVLAQTVTIRDYQSDDDFVISLTSTSSRGDEIILAKIAPQTTLQATWDATAERLLIPRTPDREPNLRGMDHLQIPILSIGVV